MLRGYILLIQVKSDLTKDALVGDVRQLFMRHAHDLILESVTASLYLDLEIVNREPNDDSPRSS